MLTLFSFLSVIFLSFILLLAHLFSKAWQCFSNYSCFGKVGNSSTRLSYIFSVVLVSNNLLYFTLLCLCLLFYNLFACLLLHGKMPLAENQTLANCVNPTLHICVPEFSWSLATLLHLDLWSYCFSMIYCSTGTLISFSHTILHYGFCVSQDFYSVYNWSWDTCIVVVLSCLFSCHISKHIQHLLLIFSLVYTSYLYIRTVYFFLPYIEIEVGSSFFCYFLSFFWLK